MRSIRHRFAIEVDKNLLHSSFVCFVKTIRRQRFTKRIIIRWFDELVDKNDYDASERKELLKYLIEVSNSA